MKNPFSAYRIEFPYKVEMTLLEDDGNTKVTIETTSEEVTFSKSKEDALLSTEFSHQHSKLGYAKHIAEYVRNNIWNVLPEDMTVTYTGNPNVEKMTEEEVEEYQREVVSIL